MTFGVRGGFPQDNRQAVEPPPLFDAWVSFIDKGAFDPADLREAYRELEAAFDPRALERRRLRRTRPGLFDEADLPLNPLYVQQVAATGAEVRVRSRWLNGVSVLATRAVLDALEDLSFVTTVGDIHLHVPKGRRDARVPADPDLRSSPPGDSMGRYGWSRDQIEQLRLPALHDAGFNGAGVRIGVVDTGFLLSHRAFSNPEAPVRVVAQWDFVDNDSVTAPEAGDYPDQHEHGTLVLGTMAANRPGELVGSAPEAEYILLKAEDAATEYFLEEKWFAAALEYAESRGADIITSSTVLYTGYDAREVDGRTSVMARAWAIAVENGVVGFQGAGNSGHDDDPATHHLLPPAGAPGVITVGAVDASGAVAPFSSDGGRIGGTVKPEFLALGRGTASVSPYERDGYTVSGGTSMATPLLAGAVACLFQAHPEWSLDELKGALRQSGSYYREHGGPDPLYVQGFGVPDLELADRWRPGPPISSFPGSLPPKGGRGNMKP